MKNILVPTDFSETADKALNFAVQTARMTSSKVILLHSFEVHENMYVDYLGLNVEFNNSMIHDTKERLNKIKSKLQQEEGIEMDTIVSIDPLQTAVSEIVDEYFIDLIVMGTLGASGIAAKIWGSRTSSVIGKTKVPVLAIPASYEWKPPKRMLLATKNFEENEGMLDFIFDLAQSYDGGVYTGVFTHKEDEKSEAYIKNWEKVEKYGELLKKEYKGLFLGYTHLFGTDFEENLQQFLKKYDIDVLAMVTYQHGFWKSLFNPSKTKQMSFHTEVPLLAIPAGYEG